MHAPAESYLESLLDEYRTGGAVESSGSFTFNPERAREMLARYRFEQPEQYILPLVASLVAGGASYVRIKQHDRTLTFEADTRRLEEDELTRLYSYLLDNRNEQVRHLALAVNAARALELETLVLEQAGLRVDFLPETPSLARHQGQAHTVIRLERRKKGFFARSTEAPERNLLAKHCHYAPIPIELDGRCLSGPIRLTDGLAWRHLHNPDLPLIAQSPGQGQSLVKPSPGPFSAVMTVGAPRQSEIVVVRHGLTHAVPIKWKGCRAIVCDPALTTDLTGMKVVRNQAWKSLLKMLWEEYLDTLHQLFHYREELDPVSRVASLTLLEQLMDLNTRHGHYNQAAHIGQWLQMNWMRQTSSNDPEHANFLYKYSLLLRKLGKVTVADQFYKQSQSIWSSLGERLSRLQITMPNGITLSGDRYVHWQQSEADATLHGANAPSVIERLNTLGLRAEESGRYPEAELYYGELVDRRIQQLGPDHPEMIRRQAALGRVYLAGSKFTKAEAVLSKAVETFDRTQDGDLRLLYQLLTNLADAELGAGKAEPARAHLERLREHYPQDKQVLARLLGLAQARNDAAEAARLKAALTA